MATKTTHFCDICEVQLTPLNKMGLKVTFGYSRGGWGKRQNHVDFTGEVCEPCYKELGEQMAHEWNFVYRGMKERKIPIAQVVERNKNWKQRLTSLFVR